MNSLNLVIPAPLLNVSPAISPLPTQDTLKLEHQESFHPLGMIEQIGTNVRSGLPELKKLGGTLRGRKSDVLAYLDHVGSSNGPTEAINGRLEHLLVVALGFKNLAHYIARSLLETGGFRPRLRPES